jgi:hypothetical protein
MITIKIDDYGANVEMENDGKKKFKYLSMPKFQQLVLQDYDFNTGLMPVGTIAFQRNGTGERIAIMQPASLQNVQFEICEENRNPVIEKFTVPVPPLLWMFSLSLDRKLKDTGVFALKAGLVISTTPLFHVPFSNVNEDGRVCWGDGNEVLNSPFKTLVGLISLPGFFFRQPFNRDLDNGGSRNDSGQSKTLQFFRKYDGKKKFPFEILRGYKKFEEVWKDENGF